MKNSFAVTTRLRKNAPKSSTMLTLDYAGINTGDGKLVPDAEKSIVITLQNQWRRAGKIPAQYTARVADVIGGQRAAYVEPESAAQTLSDAEFARMVERETKRRAAEKSGKPARAPKTEKPGAATYRTESPKTDAPKSGDGETA